MSRSLKVAKEYITKVKNALRRNGFPSQGALGHELGLCRTTINKFFTGKSIDYLNFVEICEKLGLNWEEINDLKKDAPEKVTKEYIEPKISPKERCKAKYLAEQMRGWFKALNYSFESSYEKWEENYFEWIINVPRRRGFDRILIRGVAGEAKINDFQAVSKQVIENRTDEGWIVALRRISAIVKQKSEGNNIYCYTFDELLDDTADFQGYIDWLTNEIKNKKIDTQYVSLACTKEEFDPETKQKLGRSQYNKQNGWIEGYIEKWLSDKSVFVNID